MKQKIKQMVRSMVAIAAIVAVCQTNSKAQTEDLPGDGSVTPASGCKYTGISSDYCVYGIYNVTNCVNNSVTTSCGF